MHIYMHIYSMHISCEHQFSLQGLMIIYTVSPELCSSRLRTVIGPLPFVAKLAPSSVASDTRMSRFKKPCWYKIIVAVVVAIT